MVFVEEIDLSENPKEDINSETNILSFIVRVWKEESDSEAHETIWRGHIAAVPNGKRYYFSNLNEIPDMIAAQLKTQNRAQ